jgi:hypothetical protein
VTRLARGRRTLLICQKHVEDVFAEIPHVATAHFGAIEGLDKYGDVEVLITIGRPMPSPSSIELSGSALTGKAVTDGERTKQQWPILLKDGTMRVLQCKGYDNDDANLLCRSIAQGGVLQALGRSRAVNRTAQNPVEAFVVLDDLTLPIPVDAAVHVSDVEPNEIDERAGWFQNGRPMLRSSTIYSRARRLRSTSIAATAGFRRCSPPRLIAKMGALRRPALAWGALRGEVSPQTL